MTNRTPQRITVGSRWRGFSNPYRALCAVLALLQLFLPSLVVALPSDGNVVGGHATIQQVNPHQLDIQQTTDKAIFNWKSFSIAGDETVHFMQPSVHSIALNRVVGTDPSVILGHLQSNGRIFLLNPNGILFGAGAQIDVGGLLATTLQIRDDDFMAGRYLFAQDPLKGLRTVINRGTIQVSDHGFVFLAAPGVSNEGLIVANLGTVVLGSGQALTVDLMGDGLINYALSGKVLDHVMGVDGKPLSSAVSNTGTIQADGGHVVLQAKSAGEIFSSVVNQSGVIRARSLESHGGVVQLLGGDETLVAATAAGAMRPAGDVSGAVVNTGTIDVAAGSLNAAQGSVTIVGERVGQFGSIVATGAEGVNGGDVVIASTTRALLASGSTIDISGIGHSSGGRLRVWSDHHTFFDSGATILARGGELGGNGGFVELSGKENLGFAGMVNALAPFGSAGTLLLDPRNITIATAGGSAYNPGVNNLFGNTPAADAIITPASINAAAANVVLQANNDITVTNAIAMTNNGVGITMQAGRDILVNAGVSTTNGSISMTANDSSSILANRANGTPGDIIFGVGANLSSGTGNISLTIDPATAGNYNPGSITTVRNLTTTTGNITLNSPNTVSLSGAVNAGSGIVSINANSDGAGAQGFTMNAGSSIATTDTGANAVQIIVNSPTGGTGAASLIGSITTGNGGTATVSTRGQAAVGGNTTGGAITQGAVLTVNTGAAGTIALATGAAASSITLNTAGNDFTGAVGVSSAFNVALRDANALTLGASTISGTLGVTTTGALTQSGPLTITGVTTLAAGAANNITLNNAGNDFSTVAITNGNTVALTDANALVLGASTVSGTLGVTTAGALTQSGVLTVTGVTTLAAGAANNINLATSANNFSTVAITSGNDVSLLDTNALVLGASTVSGALALTTGGALTQSGALNVTGATSFTATAANTDILLGTQANNFGGALSFAGTLGNFRDVSLRNVNAGATVPALAGLTALRNLTLTYNNAPVALPALTLTAGGSLNVTAGGAITDSGNLIVPGTTTLVAGANNITLDNANNFTGAVSITSGNNVALNDINALVLGPSTVSGTLNVTTAGAVTQTGALAVTGATTVAAGAANNITLNNVANNFSTVGITSGNNVALTDANALDLGASTVSGTFGVTTTGALTQSGPLTITGVTTLAAGAANNITLGGANNFSTVAVTSGNNVTLNDTNALILGASTVSGTLGVTTAGALTQSGVLNVSGVTTLAAGAANNITLNNAANNFSTVGITHGNNVSLRDANALNLAASTVSGTLGVTTAGALTQSGPLTITGVTTLAAGAANNITLGGANNFSTVAVTSGNNVTLNDTNALILGASTVSGTLGVTTAGALTQSGVLTVTGVTTLAAGAANNITLNNAANNFSTVGITNGNNVVLTDANALNLAASTVSGTFGVTTTGALTQSGPLTITGVTTLAAGAANNITLNNAGNDFSTVAITNGNTVALTDANALVLGASTVSGTLGVTTAGALTQSGVLTVTGVTTLAAGAANNVNLATSANNFSTVAITSGNDVSLLDTNALVLGASTVSGALALTTGGALTQSGALNVTGATSFTATAANTDILLGTQANNFGGALSFAGTLGNFRDVSLRNVNAGATVPALAGLTALRNLTLTYNNAPVALPALTLTAGGSLNVTAGGAITDSGNLIVPGTTTLVAGANNITLDNANNFTGAVSITSGNNVALNDINALVLGPSTVSGTLNVTTAGAVTQTGALAVTGATTVAAGAANNITLNNVANNFSTVGITSGNNVALTDANALDLGASTVSGTFGVTTTGALTQSGPLTITGVTTLAAGAANNITLGGANNFSTVAVTSGNNVTLNDTNALILGASTVSGTLGVTTAGALTQSGVLNVSGVTTLAAGAANNITLNNAANNFSTVGITNGNNVSLRDANALVLGASTVSGALALTTGGALTQSGALNVTGATSFTATAVNTDILLGTQANNFGGALSFAGTLGNFRDVSLRNVNAGATVPAVAGLSSLRNLTLQFDNAPITLPALTLTASGNLNVTAGGTISQSGVVTVPGTTTLATTVAGSDILLNTQANNLTGAVTFAGTQSNIRDVGLRNVNAGATVPALAGLTNLRNLTLTYDNAPITMPTLTLTAGGNLNVTAGGTISQSGMVTVPGTTTLATTVAGSDILLNTQANNLTGAVTFAGTQSNIRDVGLRNVDAGATVPALVGLTNLRNLTLTFDTAPMVLPSLTVSGNLTATAGGLISQSGALNVAGTASFDTIAAATLGSVTLANGGALTLNTSTVGGNLTVTTAAGDLTLPAGQTLTVVGDATLSPAGTVNLLGTTRIGGTQSSVGGTGSTFVLGADTNLNALALPAAGDITVNLTGNTASFAGAPLLPQAITLGNAGNSFGGPVSVTTAAPAFTGTTTNTYNLTQSAPMNLNVGQGLTVTDLGGTAGTRGNITLTNAGNIFNAVTFTGGNIAWVETGPVTIGGVSANAGPTSSGALSITANGPITQSGAVTTGGASTVAAGANDITLTNAANDFSTVGITSGNNVSLTDTNGLVLGASTVSGNLALTTGGALSQTGALAVTGTTSFIATAANTDILLDTQANNFGGVMGFAGTQTNLRDVQLRNVNAGATVPVLAGLTNLRNLALTFDNAPITLSALTASGNLSITAGGLINQSGAVAIGGTTTLATTVAGSDILLDTQANNLVGAVSFGGTLGNIRDLGLRNVNAGATIPSLAGLTNLRNLTMTFDNAPIALPALTLTAGGNLNVTVGGSITETGAITVPGTTTLATTVAGADILLHTQANNFGGAVSFGGTQSNIRDVGLRNINVSATVPALVGLTNLRNLTLQFDSAPVTLPTLTLTAGGSLNVTAGGAVTDSGNLIVTGTTTLAAGVNDIVLNNANDFIGAVSIANGTNVTLNDINALILGPSTVSGALNVTTNGALTQSGPLTVVGITALAAGANDITLTNTGNDFSTVGITSSNNVSLTDTNGLVLGASTVSGNLVLTTGGALSQTGALAVTGTTSFIATAANTDILLDTQANNFGGAVSFGGTQTNLRDVQLRNVNAGATVPVLAGLTNLRNLTLTFDNAPMVLTALTASGNLTAAAGGLISQSGALSVAGNAVFDTTAAATLGSVTLANGGALTLGTSTVGGNLVATTTVGDLTLPVGQTLTVVGDATLTSAGNVNLLGTTRIGGAQTLNGGTGSTIILAGDANLNSFALPAAGDITVNTTGTTASFAGGPILPVAINLSNASNSFGSSVQVTTAAPAFTGSTPATYNLTQSASVSLNAGQTLSVTDLGGTAGTRGNITLTNAGNSFNTVNFIGGNIAWQEANAVTIGAVSANAGPTSSGALSITANGPITQSGVVTATGLTTLAAGGNDITLNNAANNFSTVGITSSNNVSLTDTNALVLGASTVSGNLALTTGGVLSQSGALAVTGATSFTATAANTDILFDTQANNFGGAVSFGGTQTNLRDVQLRNVNAGATVPVLAGLTNLRNLTLTFDTAAMTVPTLMASGNVNLTAGGSINQSGAVTVGGTTTLATTVAGSDILLDTQANNLVGAVSFGGTVGNIRDVGVRNVNAGATIPSLAGLTNLRNLTLTFDTAPMALPALTLTAGGNLNVIAGGPITETGAIVVPGTTTLATTVAGSDILLHTQANNFGGAVSFGGTQSNIRDVGLRNINAGAIVPPLAGLTSLRNLTLTFDTAPVTLPTLTLTAGGSLNVTAGGAVTDSGNLIVTGTTTLAAGVNDIVLNNANDFIGAVSIANGTNVTLNDINALVLGPSTVSGALNVTTNGALTQSGQLTVVGITTLAAGGNDITLTNGANNFSTIGITSGNNVALTDATALNLAASTASGNITVSANDLTIGGPVVSTGGNITLTGVNTVTQSANLTAAGANTGIMVTATTGSITMAPAAMTTSSGNGTITYTAGTDVMLGLLSTLSTANGAVMVTATTGSITMAPTATTTSSGAGTISYTAGTDVTLGSLSTGGGVNVTAGGSVLSAGGPGTNVTAGADSRLEALNGVVGNQAFPMTVNVMNPGTLSIRATTAVAGISAFLTGTVPGNTLTLLNVPPGLVCFNGCPVPPSNNPLGGVFGLTPSFSYDSIVPWYLHEPSDPPMISVFATYLPKSVVTEAEVDVKSNERSVSREIPPCFPASACKPAATSLTNPVERDGVTAR